MINFDTLFVLYRNRFIETMKTDLLDCYFSCCIIISCTTKEKRNDSYELTPQETYLSFPIDEDTRLPKFCLWTFIDNQNEYIAFDNQGDEIIFIM